ncbi:MAG: hypothetical protein ACK40V_02845, partial [Anaerolineales bacterium]
MKLRFTLHFLLSIFIFACNSPAATPAPTPLSFAQVAINKPDVDSTSTPFQPSDSTDTPIPTFTISPTITSTPTQTLTPPPAPTTGSVPVSPFPSGEGRTNYILYATLNFANKTIAVDQTIRYYNNTGVNLSELVLAVPPNLYNRAFSLNAITQDNAAISSYTLSGQRLTLNLPQTLSVGSATTLVMNFSLNIPQKSANEVFGYDFNQINLVDW